jgi:hypothetical protein
MKSTDQNIAKFIFNTDKVDQIELPLVDMNPGDNEEYLFSVSNEQQGVISGVSVEYQLKIKTFHLVPLLIKLYKVVENEEELVLTCDESYERSTNNELICTTLIMEMGYSSSVLDNYKLVVEFPIEYNGEEYANLVDYISLEINSWQKT